MINKVHVTGVAGLLGSHIARAWLDLGVKVTASDNLSSGYRDNIDERVILHKLDCCNLEQMIDAINLVDVVYHCAASPHEGLSVFSPHSITKSVFETTVSVATACIVRKVKRLINFSSMARYGIQKVPYTEEQYPTPIDPYGIAKVAAEQEVALLSKVHGLEYVIAVPHNVVGPGQRYDDPYRNVVSIMINRCLQGKPPIIYGDGNQQRCFSHISDAIDPLINMALQNNVLSETINIGPDEEFVTINELARIVMEETNFTGEPIYVNPRPQEVNLAYCSSDKARMLLEYQTKKSLRDIVKEMVSWIKWRGVLPFDYYLPLEIVNDKTPKTWIEHII